MNMIDIPRGILDAWRWRVHHRLMDAICQAGDTRWTEHRRLMRIRNRHLLLRSITNAIDYHRACNVGPW